MIYYIHISAPVYLTLGSVVLTLILYKQRNTTADLPSVCENLHSLEAFSVIVSGKTYGYFSSLAEGKVRKDQNCDPWIKVYVRLLHC